MTFHEGLVLHQLKSFIASLSSRSTFAILSYKHSQTSSSPSLIYTSDLRFSIRAKPRKGARFEKLGWQKRYIYTRSTFRLRAITYSLWSATRGEIKGKGACYRRRVSHAALPERVSFCIISRTVCAINIIRPRRLRHACVQEAYKCIYDGEFMRYDECVCVCEGAKFHYWRRSKAIIKFNCIIIIRETGGVKWLWLLPLI